MDQSKQKILDNIRRHTHEKYEMPDLSFQHITYDDRLQTFLNISAGVGGCAELLGEGETVDQAIQRLYPDAKRVASNLPEVHAATYNPDEIEAPRELNGTDLVVIRGEFGVCENGAVYIEQSYKHRAIYFIAEAMVIILDRNALVDTMHEAYQKVPKELTNEFRGFISGPSKTADIEQALVKGAHGARKTVVLLV